MASANPPRRTFSLDDKRVGTAAGRLLRHVFKKGIRKLRSRKKSTPEDVKTAA